MLQKGVGCSTMRTGRHIAQHLRQTPLKQLKKLAHCDNRIRRGSALPSSPPDASGLLSNVSARLPDRKNAAGFVSIGASACTELDAAARTKAKGQTSLRLDILVLQQGLTYTTLEFT